MRLRTSSRTLHTSRAGAAQAQLAEYEYEPGIELDYNELHALPPLEPGGPASALSSQAQQAHDLVDYFGIGDADLLRVDEVDADPTDAATHRDVFGASQGQEQEPGQGRALQSYESALARPRRKRQSASQRIPDLPALPAGEQPADGHTRFDWRASRRRRNTVPDSRGDIWWYPDMGTRTQPPMTRLTEMEPFHAELRRYMDQ